MSAIEKVTATVNGPTYTLTLNSQTGAYEATVTAPTRSSYNQEGKYYGVTVTAKDVAGNTASVNPTDKTLGESLKLKVVEKVKPIVNFTSPTTGSGLTNNKPVFKLNLTDLDSGVDLSTFKLQIDSQTAIGIADCTYSEITNGYAVTYTPKAAIADGSHTITASVSDHDGNVSNIATTKIKIDTVPPTLTLSSPADKSFINKKTCIVAGVTNDVTSSPVSMTIKVGTTDQGAVTVGSDGSFSKEVTLAEGANTITITARDSIGKTTTMTRTVTVDTAPPVFESVTLSPNPVDAGKTYTISVKVKS